MKISRLRDKRAMGRWLLAWAFVIAVAGSLWYIEAPPRTAHSYEEEAVRAAEMLRSQLESDSIWARAVKDNDALRPTASVAFREADEDATAALDEFAAIEPPRGTDELRAALVNLGADVTDAVARVRITAERGEWDQIGEAAGPLVALSARLDELIMRADA
jgi:hypothetical protein